MNLTWHNGNWVSKALLALLFLTLGCQTGPTKDEIAEDSVKVDRNMGGLGLPRGLLVNSEDVAPGFVLFSPTNSSSSYLINRKGKVVHEWKGNFRSDLSSYLTGNGSLLRIAQDPDFPLYHGGGNAGRIQEFNWEGDMIWDMEIASEEHLSHHDIALMPNGNVLTISWEAKSEEEVLAAGRNPEFTPKDGLWPDKIIEIMPTKPRGGTIVWEWHMWDHMIQDGDQNLANYGAPSDHPELLYINAAAEKPDPMHPDTLIAKRRLGRIHRNATTDSDGCDVYHLNAIDYNAELDQIAISSYSLGEIFIIDHSTTIEEAAGHQGGRWGKGGDFLYRWGNPENYQRGDSTNRQLFSQHDVRWIEKGQPGEGNLTIYNNDIPGGPDSMKYSAIYEITPPVDAQGNYLIPEQGALGPEKLSWSYVAADTVSFYGSFISGAHRMENGNTFITCGPAGRFFEVTQDGDIVWEYWNPYRGDVREPNGDPRHVGDLPYNIFRATFVPANHPALADKELKPLEPQPEIYVHKKETN